APLVASPVKPISPVEPPVVLPAVPPMDPPVVPPLEPPLEPPVMPQPAPPLQPPATPPMETPPAPPIAPPVPPPAAPPLWAKAALAVNKALTRTSCLNFMSFSSFDRLAGVSCDCCQVLESLEKRRQETGMETRAF